MDSISFEDLESAQYSQQEKPFFAIQLDSESEVLTWLNAELLSIRSENQNRLEKIKNNYLRYKGIQYMQQVYQPRDVPETRKKYMPQMVLPFISDVVDEKVARLLERKPEVTVLPVHDEEQDKRDAKIAKRFLTHLFKIQNLDKKFQKWVRNSKIAGESYLWVRWNPDIGEFLPELKMLPNEEQVRLGDVEVKHMTPHWTFYERAVKFEDVNYVFFIELEYTEAMKREYPHKADKLRSDGEVQVMDYSTLEEKSLRGMTKKITFYHKKTKFLPQGYECVFTRDCILKSGPLSYKHGKLPFVRLVDIENDEELYGESFIEKVRAISSQINNSVNSMIKMFMLAGFAKWFVEAGSIDEQQLNNDVSVVRVKAGSSKPVLAQANPVGQGHFAFVEKLKEWFYSLSKSNSVMRGELPPGVTAAVAMQTLSESESRRMNSDVTNLNASVIETNQLMLETAAQFYKPNEKRTMLIVGKDNRWENLPLDPRTLAKPYSVDIQRSSGLADMRSIRTQQVIDLNTAFPGIVPTSQVVEMLDLGQSEKFMDVGSSAARAAEEENEHIQDGKGQIEPAEWEDHITHWNVHVMSMQSVGFKQKAGPQIITDMVDHIRATEMLMMDIADKNAGYAQEITLKCKGFPLFMEMPLPPPTMPVEPLPPEMPLPEQPIMALEPQGLPPEAVPTQPLPSDIV